MRRLSRLDFEDAAFVADPYPAFHAERSRGAVAWHEQRAMWLVVEHAACSQALRDRRLGRIWDDKAPAEVFEPFNLLHRNQMMENEPPDHTRLRRKVSTAFARGHVERMRPRVRSLGAELLDAVEGDTFDVLADYAEPLPVMVIAELLGAPREDFALLRAWSQAIVRMYEPSIAGDVQTAAIEASVEFADYVRELVQVRRSDVGDDLLSDLLRAQEGEDGLTDDEVLASAILLLNAGHEASVNVFGNGLVALLEHPDQWQRLLDGDADVAVVVEEMLRFDSALQLFERTAIADVELDDVVVQAGEKLAVLLGAANRDPGIFTEPDAFSVDRHPNPHLAFGAGVHFCLGAPLARVELAESLGLLVTSYPDLQLAGRPARRPTFVLRGYSSVPVSGVRAHESETSTNEGASHG
jgi:cytochrome P450